MISVAQHLIELSHYHPYDKKNSNLCPRFIPSTLSIVLEAAVCKPHPSTITEAKQGSHTRQHIHYSYSSILPFDHDNQFLAHYN